jgi:hypothetical protein
VVVVVVVRFEIWTRVCDLLVAMRSKLAGILKPVRVWADGRCSFTSEDEAPLHRIDCECQIELALRCSADELRRGCGEPNDNVRSRICLRNAIILSTIPESPK